MINTVILLSGPLATFVSIILFFVALGVLVTLHEFGHFIAAKSFKVYCSDFSIGFGPKILKLKRKKGETRFSIGLLPLGGYVQMAGEEGEVDDNVNVPLNRTLNGIARYKRIIIMSAGIIMNFIVAYVIFVICFACFPQVVPCAWYDVDPEISKDHIVLKEGQGDVTFNNNDQFFVKQLVFENNSFREYDREKDSDNKNLQVINMLSYDKFKSKNTENNKEYVVSLSYMFTGGVNNTDITRNIFIYEASETPLEITTWKYLPDGNKEQVKVNAYVPKINAGRPVPYEFNEKDSFEFSVKFANATSEEPVLNQNDTFEFEKEADGSTKLYDATFKLDVAKESFKEVGISFHKFEMWYGWDAFRKAGENWANSTMLIGQALGNLFIGQGWDQLGGPLAIFNQTTAILENNPFYAYLQTWGVISVNLALFNLLPFPGLDGWQILVELVEGSVNGCKKLGYKAKKKKKDKNSKVVEVINDEKTETIDVNINDDTSVSLNKNANLTIGDAKKDEYKEWKIPPKIKGIMSYVGLALIFGLMIFVLIKDIMGMF